ncbi:YALI0E15664p [Yarrowia lipolytica CLIB122]|jgi:hypothetical protein|uniref:YALI0E15664p n=2 Tax=Yarrowia lipolytica TaxID=4952 RepID=Q6C5S1_YARLI|nr:YALI0E15664p [Yarrowia lipolytica CLIB122]CAG79584.1 YALI0E15664p [Yarrowia lipolytica CLIB122]SEI34999.1 YALIA101S05e15698g1_1 [Yarrowia lipolytica]|eukprot:XP_503991.1 YALI0E15664p [Yarrowia lipolytica CLIB122]
MNHEHLYKYFYFCFYFYAMLSQFIYFCLHLTIQPLPLSPCTRDLGSGHLTTLNIPTCTSMGQTESKQTFRTEIFRLSTDSSIPESDTIFWSKLWMVPENASDIFTLVGENDVRMALQTFPDNIATLVRVVSQQIINCDDTTPEPQLLNCIRVLTRVLPIVFESGTKTFDDDLFWSNDILGEKLVTKLVSLLFNKKLCGTSQIWEMGVGCHSVEGGVTSAQEGNRCEILRLLVCCSCKQLYTSVNHVTTQGSRFLTCIVSGLGKSDTLLLLCSLLNLSLVRLLRDANAFQTVVFGGSQTAFWALELLLLLVVYYPPEPGVKNNFRYFLGKLKQDVDFEFIARHISEILAKFSASSGSILTGKKETRTNEIICLLWEIIQTNKRFLPWLLKKGYLDNIILSILQQIKMCESTQTLRLLSNFLLYLSDDDVVVSSFDDGTVNFNYVLGQLFSVITQPREEINPIIPTLVECIYNLSVQAKHIDYTVSCQLVDIFDVLSSPSFLFANSTNRFLLELTLESINAMLEYNFQANKSLVFVLQKRRSSFEKLHRLVKEKGKEPTNGEEDLSWLEDLPLDTIDTVYAMIESSVPGLNTYSAVPPPSSSTSPASDEPKTTKDTPSTMIDTIGTLNPPVQPTKFHKIEFQWDPVLLGWYLSLIWTSLYTHEARVGRQVTSLADTVGTGYSTGAAAVGVWNRTHTKLFKVQQSVAAPNLGAVDAVALNVWKRITNR